jgi:release factor glutamine methyltransferase
MAQKNAELHGLLNMCEFIEGDITNEMPKRKFDLIVSNPPYIPSRDIETLSEEVKKEPMLALDGGDDGLDIIRFLIGDGLSYLKENGAMLIEFGYDQEKEIKSLADECENISSYEILYDYGNNPRVLVIYK